MEIKFNLEPENFCCEHSFLADALNTLEYINKNKSGHFSSIAILGYDLTIESIFKALCSIDFKSADADLSLRYLDFDYVDYEDEYALILTLEDCYTKEFTVSIEKATYEDGTYKTYEQDHLYIDEACTSELVKKHLQFEDNTDIFYIEDEYEPEDFGDSADECDGNCENCELNGEEEFEKGKELYTFIYDVVDEILKEKFTK